MVETATRTNPFPGLRSFEPEEDHLFFGREERIDELVTRLRRSRFLSVVGTSGSGKSSLIRSGLIPSLYSGLMSKAGSDWRVVLFRPGEDPIGHLADALNRPEALGTEEEHDETSRALLEVTLRRSAMGLVDCIRQARVPEHENILVVVDQFEELFRFKRSLKLRDSRDEAVAFVKLLLSAARQEALPIYIVITMRSDFIGNCTEFEGLTEAINDGQYLVPRMTREERRSAIVGPVAVCEAEIAPRLVLRLLNDVGDDPDQLPILQHALMRTWDEWERHHAEGEPIDLRHYEAIGTMKEALSQHAEEAYREISDEKSRAIAEKMFKALTDRGSDARGVRSPRPLEEICELTDASEEEVAEVVEAFRRPGRSFLMPPAAVPLRPASIIDISHESLMRIWKRLIQWVDEEARSAQVYLRISKAAAEFQEGKAGLLHDPELQLALNWRDETKPNAVWAQRYDVAFERAMVFLEHSQKQRDRETEEKERQRRRQLQWARRLAIILGLGALVTLVFGLYAMTARIEALESFREALRQKEIAEGQRREAETQRELAETQTTRAEQARAAEEQQRRLAVEQRRRAEEQEREAVRQRGQAEAAMVLEADAREEAEAQRQRAVDEKERADEMRVQAETSESEARRLRVLAVARELAIQTSRLVQEDQGELAALLAVQAYRLHSGNGGDPGDPDLFEALRAGLSRVAPEELKVLRLHQDAVRALAATPDSAMVASGGDDGAVHLLDLGSPGAAPKLLGSSEAEVRSLAWVGGDSRLGVGSLDGAVEIWGVSPSEPIRTILPAHASGVTAIATGDGMLASAGLDGEVRLWHLDEPRRPTVLQPTGSPRVSALAFTGRGRLAGAVAGRGILFWDPQHPEQAPRTLASGRKVHSLAVSSNDRFAAGTEQGSILLWSAGRAEDPAVLQGHSSEVTSLSFAPDGTRLASASLDGSVRIWNVRRLDDKPIELHGHAGWVWAVAFLADGETLVSGGADRSVRVWPTRSAPLANAICERTTRDLTPEEWSSFLPADIAKEPTCP
jgi:WD40 repeat protein/energy-coupling factor transporter ATP-binding protein EcfA2